MIGKNLILVLVVLSLFSFRSDKKAFVLYNSEGKEIKYEKLLESAKEADVILFGEFHDNPIVHWLEHELTRELFDSKKGDLILGAEMFESDDQIVLNEYLSGLVSEKTLKDEAKLWTNYPSDYKPLLDFAKTNKLKFIATNIPRRYANMVYSKGLEILDSLDSKSLAWISPLPVQYDSTLTCYREIFKQAQGHGGQNLPKSQAVKDATMAFFILKNLSPGKTLIHFNGSYHSDHHQGIEWYLKKTNPGLKVLTIGSTEQDEIDELDKDSYGLANYVICTPVSMSKSYRP